MQALNKEEIYCHPIGIVEIQFKNGSFIKGIPCTAKMRGRKFNIYPCECMAFDSDNLAKINDYKVDFSTLAAGVDDYGNNVSLTADQYERYKSIVSDIVGMSPDNDVDYRDECGYVDNKENNEELDNFLSGFKVVPQCYVK